MNLLRLSDPFQFVPGTAPVAVGAPHHGTRPSVDADWGTGPIALALAARLKGSAVVVSDMRRIVDVNKDPLSLDKSLRRHAIRYQNALFAGRPGLVIEIHGHTSGRYDVEASTGFELDPAIPADASYLEKLSLLRRTLPDALESRLGQRPTVGVWPLDRDVEKTATNTFTFQKVRRARYMAGLNWYGLHIELNAALRVGRGSKMGDIRELSPQVVEVLSDSLAAAIRASFEPLPSSDASIPPRAEANSAYHVLAEHTFKVARTPEKRIGENIVFMHPDTLRSIGALEGDSVILRQGEEELRSWVAPSRLVQLGQAALTQRMRAQINVKPGQWITLVRISKRPVGQTDPSPNPDLEPALVAYQIKPGRQAQLWLECDDLERLALRLDAPVRLQCRAGIPAIQTQMLITEHALPLRAAALSDGLAAQLGATLGETLRLAQD